MVFSSLLFLYCFLPVAIILYFICPNIKTKNIVLVILSLFFYAWGEPLWVILLIFSSVLDFSVGQLIGRFRGRWMAKAALAASLIINLGLLGVFKYSGFIVDNFNALTGLTLEGPGLSLPIGISFYTFQTLSYSIDVYRNKVNVQRSFLDFLLFVSLFPQLVAGPILRYSELENQLSYRKTSWQDIFYGTTRFLCGLGKKVLIANYAGSVASGILDGTLNALPIGEAWLGIILFGFQIYFDFSGYSDMAIGLGRIFGFHYSENFNLPYTSKSVTEFWRRWHISLGQFFRDYVYIPMGGNRKHQLLNLLVVWFLTGLWHGASWNFVLWGLFFFVFIYIEKRTRNLLEKVPGFIRLFITLFLVEVSWMLFYFVDTSRLVDMLRAAFGFFGNGFSSERTQILFINNIILLIICVIGSSSAVRTFTRSMTAMYNENSNKISYKVLYLGSTFIFNFSMLILSTASLVGVSYNPFLYFRF